MTDRDVYLKLAEVADELARLAEQAETYVGNAALQTAATTLAGTAKAVYDHLMSGEGSH
ncbi:MAG: hypothetical protein JNK30_12990 [Phenylobacterium sp.]|uniref:hypothetical protein n=1 Tax=Phenylobacterium sp. TaxID=1871053 RepID=UPI001A415936|nr:hypothetical protein [Phenylobacterium sp.]MBL8772290.1 hypothetical protein [Phenylobacterium sp.]